MHRDWLDLGHLLRPDRPALARCLPHRAPALEALRTATEARIQALTSCEDRINDARADAFAKNDGVVGALMTDLEREWRRLSRVDLDAGMMDLWARIAPPSWIDRKRWRDAPITQRVDAAIALAADPRGVEAAERAALEWAALLEHHGEHVAPRVGWTFLETDTEVLSTASAAIRTAARAACPAERAARIEARACRMAGVVLAAASAHLPTRPALARDYAHAAFVDFLWSGAHKDGKQSPIGPLHAIWRAGYSVASVNERGILLEIPALGS